jgi:hypothetical protein
MERACRDGFGWAPRKVRSFGLMRELFRLFVTDDANARNFHRACVQPSKRANFPRCAPPYYPPMLDRNIRYPQNTQKIVVVTSTLRAVAWGVTAPRQTEPGRTGRASVRRLPQATVPSRRSSPRAERLSLCLYSYSRLIGLTKSRTHDSRTESRKHAQYISGKRENT